MIDIIIGAIVVVILGLAIGYMIRAKKAGVKCIGCSACSSTTQQTTQGCDGGCSSCSSCHCGDE